MSFAATLARAWRPRLSAQTNTDNDNNTQTHSPTARTIPHPLDGRDIELDPLVLEPPALSTSAPDPQPSPVRPTFTLGRSATTRARRTDDDGLGEYSLLTLLRAHPENLFAQPTALTPSLLASRALISLPAATVMAQTLAVAAMSLADPSVRARELGGISEAINRAEALVARLEARVHAHEAGRGAPSPARMGTGAVTSTSVGAGTGRSARSPEKDAQGTQRKGDDDMAVKPKAKSSIPRPVPKHSKSTPVKIPPSAWRDEARDMKAADNHASYAGKKRSPRSSVSSLSTSPSSLSSLGTPPKDTFASSVTSSQNVPNPNSNSTSKTNSNSTPSTNTNSNSTPTSNPNSKPPPLSSPLSPQPAPARMPSPRTKPQTPRASPSPTPMTSPSLAPTSHSPSLSRFARDIVETRRHGFTLTRARVALECYPRWKGCGLTLMTEVRVAMARIQAIEREAGKLGV